MSRDFEEPSLPLVDGHGMPIVVRKRGRGRPPFEATPENQRLVAHMLKMGLDRQAIAQALGCCLKTLERRFKSELELAASALILAEAKIYDRAEAEAKKGNVGAIKFCDQKLEKWKLARVAEAKASKGPTAKPVGVKEQRQQSARNVGGRYAPPAAPLLN